jgi:hypothetical protein|tara:strand:- start:146 stop:658 length:513 start_codon:yes stop_codon:yes gene_type:complete
MIKILTFSLICLLFLSCNALKPKKVDTRENPINAQERARKNINEGKGTSLKDLVGRGKTTYEFSTSNPMWRASLEILDFLPFSTVDYSGGMIVTDWYAENNSSESIKITVRFLANEVRSDSLKVTVHKRVCKSNNDCRINLLNSSEIGNELRSSIIRKAAILEKESKKKK